MSIEDRQQYIFDSRQEVPEEIWAKRFNEHPFRRYIIEAKKIPLAGEEVILPVFSHSLLGFIIPESDFPEYWEARGDGNLRHPYCRYVESFVLELLNAPSIPRLPLNRDQILEPSGKDKYGRIPVLPDLSQIASRLAGKEVLLSVLKIGFRSRGSSLLYFGNPSTILFLRDSKDYYEAFVASPPIIGLVRSNAGNYVLLPASSDILSFSYLKATILRLYDGNYPYFVFLIRKLNFSSEDAERLFLVAKAKVYF